MISFTRAEVCAVACAEAWRGDGEIVASPMGVIPSIGARLARATFEPDLLLHDGEAGYGLGTWPLGAEPEAVEGWIPYRGVFDLLWSGRRHVMMGPSQLDRYGNANISRLGPHERPRRQLLGVRGAPGNTVNHPTSYWIARHDRNRLVPGVDMVSGVGYDSAEKAGPAARRFLDLRKVVTNLAVLDFGGERHAMRLVSAHPGVEVEEVVAATGFELELPGEVPCTREPTAEELRLIREVIDPRGLREREVPS